MADYIKKKIVEKLARFTRNIKPSDISLSILRGKGELSNLDLNTDVISSALQLPPWISIDHVFCDSIKLDVPFTDINKKPIICKLHQVCIHVSTTLEFSNKKGEIENVLGNIGSSNSSYGLTEKIIDGMRIEIDSIIVEFSNSAFDAKLEILEVLIQSTTSDWNPAPLPQCRIKNEAEGTVIIYKKATWGSIKLEGNGKEIGETKTGGGVLPSQLKLVSTSAEIRIALKRQLSNCKVLCTRASVSLGDLSWAVTQSQLKSLSRLAQSLTEAAVSYAQFERKHLYNSSESIESIESSSGSGSKRTQHKKRGLKTDLTSLNQILEYQVGKKNLPSHEVIQDSFHVKTGNVEIQLCDEKASLLLELKKLNIDIYLNQLAGSGRCHWNKANMRLMENVEWSSNLVKEANKFQALDYNSVNMYHLRERGIILRCSDFHIRSISDKSSRNLLPIISCDKKTFNLPDDIDNPAIQFSITQYYYPAELGNKFLIPRPNIFIYLSPLHVNIHQEQFLWLAEFTHGVALTVNLNLILSAHTEGQHFIQELKAKHEDIQRLPGIDVKLFLPYSKITLPLTETYTDGRPCALQVETGGIHFENHTLLSLLSNPSFLSAWESVSNGWFPTSEGQFPHSPSDPNVLPSNLAQLINTGLLEAKNSPPNLKKVSSVTDASRSPKNVHSTTRNSVSDVSSSVYKRLTHNQLKLLALKSWYVHTRCVTLSFVADLSHEATLYTHQFVNDFPLGVWLFEPKNIEEVLLRSSPGKSSSPTPSLSLPSLYALVDIDTQVKVELQHKQYLFLMCLKESFQGFKNSLMQYLSIDTLIEMQESEAFQLKIEDDNETDVSCNTMASDEEIKQKLRAVFTTQTDSNKTRGDYVTVGINVTSVDVAVMLPSLTKVVNKQRKTSKFGLSLDPSGGKGISISGDHHISGRAYTEPPTPNINLPSVTISPDTPPMTSNAPISHAMSLPQLTTPTTPPVVNEECMSALELTMSETCSVSSDFVVVGDPLEDPLAKSMETSVSLEDGLHRDIPSPTEDVLDFSIKDQEIPLSIEEECALQEQQQSKLISSTDENISKKELLHDTDKSPLDTLKLSEPVTTNATRGSSLVSISTSSIVPEYILYISTGFIRGLTILSSEGINVSAAVDTMQIDELKEEEYKEKEMMKERRQRGNIKREIKHCLPVIKARAELGKSVDQYFPEISDELRPDAVMFIKANGLQPKLALKNVMIIKDFFEDEVELEMPVPLQLRIMETQVILKDTVECPLDHPRNITVNIPDIFINRGPRAQNTNLVLAEPVGVSPDLVGMVPESVGVVTDDALIEGEGTDGNTSGDKNTNEVLLESFRQFIQAFQDHTRKGGRVSVPHPEKVSQLLKELQQSLSAPPSYLDAMSCDFYRSVTSPVPHPTIDQLQTEIERLRSVNKQLLIDLQTVKEEKSYVLEEQQDIVQQLIEIKMKYATLNLTHEKQLTQIDKLLTEKTDLQEQLKTYVSLDN